MIYRLQLILYTSKFNLKIYFVCIQIKYVQFHNIKFKISVLIVLETSFKTDIKLRMSTFISHQKHTSVVTPSHLAYGLCTCENVDNYGWLLKCYILPFYNSHKETISTYHFQQTYPRANVGIPRSTFVRLLAFIYYSWSRSWCKSLDF